MELIEIRITAPDPEVADRIATRLVHAGLAACVQQLPGISSTYVWEGRVERAEEVLLLVKTASDRFDDVCAAAIDIHPYDTPEILAVPVSHAEHAYRAWVMENSRT